MADVKRKTWKRRFDFIINIMGVMIGLGNIWRFPYLCYKNGGGAFLIPYFIIIIVVAFPLIVLESAIGQYCGHSAIKAWKLVPLMRGIGGANLVGMALCNLYYPIVLTWALRWFVASFSDPLPWSTGRSVWNTENVTATEKLLGNTSLVVDTNSSYSSFEGNLTHLTKSSTEDYWKRHILGLTPSLEETGGIKWDLLGCFAVIWILTYFSIWKGIEWTSKVVYVTATLPLAMIAIVMVRGLTLPGASGGIQYYLQPNVTKLLGVEIWVDAASQVLFSTCLCTGAIVTMSEYNRFHHNFFRDSMILISVNSCASFLSGFAIFSVLGYLAQHQNASIADVAESGPGLIFIAYPTALSLIPIPQFWSALFFMTIILLGFDGQFIYVESTIACIKDVSPRLFQKLGREVVIALASFIFFLAGIPMVTRGGMYVFYLFDNYAVAGWCMFFIGTCECLTVGWLYGADRLCDNIQEMLGYNIPRFWFKFCWKFAAPVVSLAIFIYSLVQYKPLTYDRSYVYPVWANVLGWMLALSSMLWIPCTAVYALWNADGQSLSERLQATLNPPKDWANKRTKQDKNQEQTNDEEKMLNTDI